MEKQTEEKSFDDLYVEVSANAELGNYPPFRRLMEMLEGWEHDAHERMIHNHSKELAWPFQQLWIQRKDLLNGIRAWVKQNEKQRDEMVEQMRSQLEIA